jgi:hypothetical protein
MYLKQLAPFIGCGLKVYICSSLKAKFLIRCSGRWRGKGEQCRGPWSNSQSVAAGPGQEQQEEDKHGVNDLPIAVVGPWDTSFTLPRPV